MAAFEAKMGIELEMLLTERYRHMRGMRRDIEWFGYQVALAYNQLDRSNYPKMRCRMNVAFNRNNLHEWLLTDDLSLEPSFPDQYPVEIVSPVLSFSRDSQWRTCVRQLWATLGRFCNIATNETCATHVHFSLPGNQRWDISTVQCVSRTVLYFEPAIEVLMPEERRRNGYAKSLSADNPQLHGKSLQDCFYLIDKCATIPEVVELLNEEDRNYGYNFINLLNRDMETIEFRRSPGVTTTEQCLAWVEFAVSFLVAATRSGTATQLSQYGRDVEGLKQFIHARSMPGVNEGQLMSLIFLDKAGSLEPTPCRATPANTTPED